MNDETSADNKGQGGWLFFLAGLVVMLFAGWVIFPPLLYSSKDQPVSFSHKKHIEGAGLECEQCHAFREDGTFMGTANMTGDFDGACLNCHDDPETMQGADPREKKFLEEYVAQGKERIDWLVYSKQPPCVFFPHSIHVKKAGVECRRCHGPMAEQDEPPVYQENRLTGYSRDIWGRNISGMTDNEWESMKMSDCGDCHQEKGASNACFVCHK
ncbi:MAG: cytochrome c3 family protein [Deltaproteobacteria bacterium]|nr:cytochrome c3 family protein [Deltaproteobacteria bacterium]